MSRSECFALSVVAVALVLVFALAFEVGHERREHMERLIKAGIPAAEADMLVYGAQHCEGNHDR